MTQQFEQTNAERQRLSDRLAQTQAELSSAEAKVINMQKEFNELRQVAQSFVETAGNEKRRQNQESDALVEAVGKYQEQLQRQQQLMDGIQKSRNDLLMEVHHLRTTANESITIAASSALDWDQQLDQKQRTGTHGNGGPRTHSTNDGSTVFGTLSYPSSGPTGSVLTNATTAMMGVTGNPALRHSLP